MNSKCSLSAFAFLIAGILPSCFAEEGFNPRQVLRGSLPPIVDPEIVSREDADGGLVHDHELVLGVVVGGKARAYTINALTGPSREIINDKLGGRSIAATW